ncbi:MAG: YIP1 family protein [Candidatus Methanoperedens sp.]|nr:YIP1 family protein [Candidatus Methanoperedens sp.]
MGFIKRIIDTLKRPKEAMREISNIPLIEEAVMIVGIYALFSAADLYVRSSRIVLVTETNLEFAQIIGVITGILAAFITWLILTGIIHNISLAIGGKGRFYPHMMVLVGYAMLPLTFSAILSTLIIYSTGSNIVNVNPFNSQQMLEEIQNSTPYVASEFISYIAWIWSFLIISFGIQLHQKLSKKSALITVAIPLGLWLGLSLLF